jgi:hypothetical protein
MDFWAAALGFLLGLAANKTSELWMRFGANRDVKGLAGEWVAYNYSSEDQRSVDVQPMLGAGLTVISAKSWWTTNSHILTVHAQDIEPGEPIKRHTGFLAIDRTCPWRGIRTIRYVGSDEITEQRIEIGVGDNTLYLFDKLADGTYSKKHALRRRVSPTSFILNSMASDPVNIGTAVVAKTVPDARRGYALAFFIVACFWLLAVTILFYLNGFSISRISDSVLIAAIATVPVSILGSVIIIFRQLFPGASADPHVANFVVDPATGRYRMLPTQGIVTKPEP